jgi:hypothetical protein
MPPPRSAAPASDDAERRRVRTQIERPSERNPGGSVIEGWFRVIGGLVYVEDMEGRTFGSAAILPGDDVLAIARKLLREKKLGGDFYAPIDYRHRVVH